MKVDDAKYLISTNSIYNFPEHDKVEIILLGRSNVGKSSFLNYFSNRNKLAYFSSKPGKTQTLNLFEINDKLMFVDAPGYGYAKVSKSQREEFGKMIEDYLVFSEKLVAACLLIDFRIGPTEDDILMYNYLKHINVRVILIATKKDKIKKNDLKKQEKKVLEKICFDDDDIFYPYSTKQKQHFTIIHNIFEEVISGK